jgi:type III pantothenate kinase
VLLSVDIGNTNITLGVFDGNCLIKTFRLTSDKKTSQAEYEKQFLSLLKDYRITDCIIGSVVVELNSVIESVCQNIFGGNVLLYNPTKHLGIKINLPNPSEVGVDRIANAYCAQKKYSSPTIVVDVGTAITFDIVSKQGEFIGGVIMSGINLQLKSLHDYTSKLPLLEADSSSSAIGNSTKTAILSGVIRGVAGAVESLIKQCENELEDKVSVIGTGGQAEFLAQYMTTPFDIINKDLTLEGLKELYWLNKN